MPLQPGTRLGPYEIHSALGAGGMGEVYRARDAKLERDVAIKVLPDAVLGDPERIARFEREARLLAALSHPHIAGVYGLEHAGSQRFIAMELVEGESLAERLRTAPLPVDEALALARQVAEALSAAHDKGIVHRDLKPANVMITGDGRAKVLDFGLAKMIDGDTAAAASASMSPTFSVHATMAGTLLGTAAYMSPEQARGRTVDKRSDVWAFGCLLFEMLTARRAFAGDDTTETIAAVVRGEPDWAALPADVPPRVATLIRGCLVKDPRQRYADIAVPIFLLGDASAAPADAPVVAGRRPVAVVPWGIAALALAAAAAALLLSAPWTPHAAEPMEFGIVLPRAAGVSASVTDRMVDISPDGRQIAYSAQGGRLMIRALDRIEPRRITDLTSIRSPFFSPDGKWIAFFSGSDLMKVPVAGGPPVTIARVAANTRGGAWISDGRLVVSTSDRKTGLLVVPEAGGEPRPLTTVADGVDHHLPAPLPDSRGILYTVQNNSRASQIAVLDLSTGTSRTIIDAAEQAFYVDSGHIVYAASGSLFAVPFDLARLAISGDPVLLADRVFQKGTGATDYAVSRTGTLVYAPANDGVSQRQLVWVDRQGRETAVPAPPRAYFTLRLSPDGHRVALDIRDREQDVWIWDLRRETMSRLSFNRGLDPFPVWTPDGRSVVYMSSGAGQLVRRAADGSGDEQPFGTDDYLQFAQSFTPDGKRLLITQQRSSNDLVLLDLEQGDKETSMVATDFTEGPGEISPDGHWLAYQSSESGQDQIYVRPFPDAGTGGRVQVSRAGGSKPVWSRNQRELFYIDYDGGLVSVPVTTAGTVTIGPPKRITATRYPTANQARSYDVTPDGQRFLFIKDVTPSQSPAETPANLIVVVNWLARVGATPAK